MMTRHRGYAAILSVLSLAWICTACGGGRKPLTPLEIEQAAYHKVVDGLRGKAYRTAHAALPESRFSISHYPSKVADESVLATVIFLALGQKRLALYEVERFQPDPANLDQVNAFRLLRGIIYLVWRWPLLADEKFQEIAASKDPDDPAVKERLYRFRVLAQLGIAALLLDAKKPDEAAAQILSANDRLGQQPFGQMLLAIAASQKGDKAEAQKIWGSVATELNLPEDSREFLQQNATKVDFDILLYSPHAAALLGALAAVEVAGKDELPARYKAVRDLCAKLLGAIPDVASEPPENGENENPQDAPRDSTTQDKLK